jgi:hypothetical protein
MIGGPEVGRSWVRDPTILSVSLGWRFSERVKGPDRRVSVTVRGITERMGGRSSDRSVTGSRDHDHGEGSFWPKGHGVEGPEVRMVIDERVRGPSRVVE